MAIPEPPIPAQLIGPLITNFGQLTEATKAQVAATLAAAIITASGRPHSIQQALDIARDIQYAMYPAHGYGHYKEWEKVKESRLNKVHGPT